MFGSKKFERQVEDDLSLLFTCVADIQHKLGPPTPSHVYYTRPDACKEQLLWGPAAKYRSTDDKLDDVRGQLNSLQRQFNERGTADKTVVENAHFWEDKYSSLNFAHGKLLTEAERLRKQIVEERPVALRAEIESLRKQLAAEKSNSDALGRGLKAYDEDAATRLEQLERAKDEIAKLKAWNDTQFRLLNERRLEVKELQGQLGKAVAERTKAVREKQELAGFINPF